MGLFDNFPWVNTHELNLNWIIQKMKEWGKESAENVSAAKTAAENAATLAGNAATLAGNAATAAENAATSAGNAATSAGNAATSAGNAATSAENAATSAENAAQTAERFLSDFGYIRNSTTNDIYRTIDVIDPATNSNEEYLFNPDYVERVNRVTGHVKTKVQSSSDKFYHYELVKNFTVTSNRKNYTFNVYPNNLNRFAELVSFEIIGFYSTQSNGALTTSCQNVDSFTEAAWTAKVTSVDGVFTLTFNPNFDMSVVNGTTLIVKFIYMAK